MDDDTRRAYRNFGTLFIVVGGSVTVLTLLQAIFRLGVFRGEPLLVGIGIFVIGAVLVVTVRKRPGE